MRQLFFFSLFFFGALFLFLPESTLATVGAVCSSDEIGNGRCRTTQSAEQPCPIGEVQISTTGCNLSETCCRNPGSEGTPAPVQGTCSSGFTRQSGVCFPSATTIGLSDMSALTLITNVLNWLLGIIGVLAVVVFVISGVQYITAAGDETMIETAKRNITYAIIGLVVALAGLIIVNAIAGLTGAGGGTAVY